MPRSSPHAASVERLLRDAAGPMSAAEVAEALAHTGIGIATVYRLLGRGAEEGRYVAVEMPHGPARYEPADRPHHHHFACTACEAVYDVPGCTGNLKKLVPEGFTLDAHEILLTGRCADCSAGSKL
ncbi:Fur family transcriptional regulator [Phycisphaera mikurensis]|uniref:Fur family transcriptional regulator n=1 Tax=Phycisphaera mikurensis (strain NBRC 102666 / KCTC 22515 / FYK2301M01) TaxID=1142394 RepID=I0IC80_PHYMF|nr:transcriptional repressor [Phycisphaera mikurensis]MBB6441913.1 Fur family ferric uptake transcriptional regulator [Phycisphaera mikurensis]BAM02868.1 Fur family transcriptional regulator [Phycisphaera mikurensis NBRC 102666]